MCQTKHILQRNLEEIIKLIFLYRQAPQPSAELRRHHVRRHPALPGQPRDEDVGEIRLCLGVHQEDGGRRILQVRSVISSFIIITCPVYETNMFWRLIVSFWIK